MVLNDILGERGYTSYQSGGGFADFTMGARKSNGGLAAQVGGSTGDGAGVEAPIWLLLGITGAVLGGVVLFYRSLYKKTYDDGSKWY